MFCFDGADARAMQALGFQLCAISSDQTLLHAVAGANSPPRAPDELRDGRRHWKNRFEHQYIVSAGMAASGRCGGVQLMAADTRQNVHLWA
jgi:hypothetical protein